MASMSIADIEESTPAIVLPSIRALAARWAADKQQDIADQMFDYITAGISSLIDDDALTRMARGTCLGIVELVLAMMEHGIPADRAEPPVVATEYVRLIAERGIPLEDVLRSYRLGHACFARIWADAIMELTQDSAELVRGVRETERFLFAFIDVISSKVSAVYLQQREHLHSRISSARGDVVRAILAGDNVDITRAEVALGHCLTGPQLAFISWTDGDTTPLAQVAAAMQETLRVPRPVLVTSDDGTLSGWFDMSRGARLRIDALAVAAATAAPQAHVALGVTLPGPNGFRRSRACAERTRRVIVLGANAPPTLTEWKTIALVDALCADLDAARELARVELRGLARGGDHLEMLRRTAHAFVVSGFSYAAAAASLHIHRNTALQRVKKAEALRGRPLGDRPAELLAALALLDTIGPTLLDH
jgi:hypothetical protein